jgi:hypothetical protein
LQIKHITVEGGYVAARPPAPAARPRSPAPAPAPAPATKSGYFTVKSPKPLCGNSMITKTFFLM